jgi:hypothetical protein
LAAKCFADLLCRSQGCRKRGDPPICGLLHVGQLGKVIAAQLFTPRGPLLLEERRTSTAYL